MVCLGYIRSCIVPVEYFTPFLIRLLVHKSNARYPSLTLQISSPFMQEATLTARAVRNLPWSAELWCRRLRSLERSSEFSGEGSLEREAGSATAGAGGVVAAVRSVWLEALSNALPSPDDYVKVLKMIGTSFIYR